MNAKGRFFAGMLLWCCCLLTVNGNCQIPDKLFVTSKINVIVFLSVDCPISQKYTSTLNELVKSYSSSVFIKGIIPGKMSNQEVRRFRKEYKTEFLINADPDYRWTDLLNPKVTPEVFVFTDENKLIYQGAIDNWFYDLGGYRQQITENYLIDVIQQLIDGDKSSFKKTDAVGCIIQKPVKK